MRAEVVSEQSADFRNDPEATGDELKPGTQLLHGQYTIERYLSAGGFGITYLARDSLDRRVVIKECFLSSVCRRSHLVVHARSRAHTDEMASVVNLFLREARSLAKLAHPNIVGVHQVFEDNGTAYIALDFISGTDLLGALANPAVDMSPDMIRYILIKLLDAVAFIHKNGMLHRDISPDNVLLDDTGNPILIDFGAARDQGDGKPAARALSTMPVVKDGYSPQELYIVGSANGPWSDLYALAATVYHLLTGQPPPNSQMRLSAVASDTADPYVPLVGRVKGYDEKFLAAIDKALEVLPKNRLQSASEWLELISPSAPKTASVLRLSVPEPATGSAAPSQPATAKDQSGTQGNKGLPLPLLLGGVAAVIVGAGLFFAMPGDAPAPVTPLATAEAPAADPLPEAVKADPIPAAPVPQPAIAVATDAAPAPTPAPSVTETETETDKAATAAEIAKLATSEVSKAPKDLAEPEPEAAAIAPVVIASPVMSNWTVDLPFDGSAEDPALVAKVDDAAPDWLKAGLQVTAVNGVPVGSVEDLAQALRNAGGPADDTSSLTLVLTTADPATGAAADHTLSLPIVQETLLLNGVLFRTRMVGTTWETRVAQLPAGFDGDLRVGDLLAAHLATERKIDGRTTLKDLLDSDIEKGISQTGIAVLRDGQMWMTSLPLSAG